jgi:hypothetical protein
MFRKLFSIMVLMITVLSVNLLTGWITDYIVASDVGLDPYRFTAFAMLALVFILVPAYSFLAERVELLVAKVLLSGTGSFGRIFGLLLSFSLIFALLFAVYLHEWFGINFLHVVKAYFS